MKSGLVAMLHAALAIRRAGVPLRGCIELLFVPDEETGGEYGSAAVARMGRLAAGSTGMLLPEPTSGVVWSANRGAITLDVTVKGREAHVGLMRHGVNAVEQALPLLNRLFALKRDLDARRGSLLLVGGRVDAGVNFNLVPASCHFTIDRRIDPDEDFEVEKRRVLDLLDRSREEGVDLSVRVIQEGRSASTPTDGPLARALARSVEVVTGAQPVFEPCPGLLETRFYVERGVPAFAYGPGILAVSHGPQEFVKISRMVECAKVYALTACDLLG
jgi:acetylornithine deacetylase/succinyl-diaminopimelate desuccinylase-like protein